MYVPNPGDYIMAVDAKTGDVMWDYRRKLPEASATRRTATSPSGATILINASADNIMYALDARTGKLVWETPVFDPKMRAATSCGPIIANGKVITGRQCQPDAGRDACVVTAHDARTGKELWRTTRSRGPASRATRSWGDVPIERALARRHVDGAELRSGAEPRHHRHVGHDPGAEVHRSAATTSSTSFTTRTLAINADTGKMVWYYQHIVDHWDLDHPFERMLVDTAVARIRGRCRGSTRRSSRASGARSSPAFPARPASSTRSTGTTGEFLWARPTVVQNVDQHDRRRDRQGHRQSRGALHEDQRGKVRSARAHSGGKNWPAGAYSPQTNMMYYAAAEHLHDGHDDDGQARPVEGLRPQHAVPQLAPGTKKVGRGVGDLGGDRRDDVEGTSSAAGMLSLVATGGGLVFGGDANGHFRALRREDRQGAVGHEPRVAGQRLSDQRLPSTASSTSP